MNAERARLEAMDAAREVALGPNATGCHWRFAANWALGAVFVVCVLAMVGGLYPGIFVGVLELPILLLLVWPYAIPLLVVTVAGIFVARLVRRGRPARLGPLLIRAAIAITLATVTVTLRRMDVLHEWGFAISRPAFERLLATAPPVGVGAHRLGRLVGIYWIDEYGGGRDGGVYFRYCSGVDGLFDTMSYGLCYRPGEPIALPEGSVCRRVHQARFVPTNHTLRFGEL